MLRIADHTQECFRLSAHRFACSVQIWRGKAWGIWSHVETSGRQRVGTQGAVPDEESQNPSCYVSTRIGGKSIRKAASIPSIVHDVRDRKNYYDWAPSLVCVYLTPPHMTKSPNPPHSIFAYCKRSKTGGGNSLGTRLVFA